MGQDKVVVRLEQYQPIQQALLALANGVDPAADRRHALAQIEVEPFDKRGMYAFTGGRGEWALIKPGEIGLTPTERTAEGIH